MKAAQKLLCAPTIGGGEVPREGVVVVEGFKGVKKPPSRPEYTKTAPKTGAFAALIDLKSLKTFFYSKYLTRYTSKMFFE